MGFENDKLGRKEYADILTKIIEKPENYKRNSDSDSFIIAIDSSWGTGKTEFLKMWGEELSKQKDEKGKNEYIVIKYNAWENDFAKDPLQSIIYTILTNKAFDTKNNIEKGKEVLAEKSKNMLEQAFETVINATKQISIPEVQVVSGLIETGVEVGKTAIQAMRKETCMEEEIQEFKDYKGSIEKIKDILEQVTKKTKIILLIDELDRCKPLFAIKLLEVIKHIFNVKNMSFVFALDMTQLSYSVKKVYGSEIDAAGYICRFFDYITKMPNPDTRRYIEYIMEKKPLIRNDIHFEEDNGYVAKMKFIDILQEYAQNFQLSLRDINTIYCNFIILEERELKEIDNSKAYALYLFLLLIKYKNITLFNKIFITHSVIVREEPYFYKMQGSNKLELNTFIDIADNKKIEDIMLSNDNIIKIHNDEYSCKENGFIYKRKYGNQMNLLNILFYSDMKNYNNIKEMRIGDYIHKKLELFNFEWNNKED